MTARSAATVSATCRLQATPGTALCGFIAFSCHRCSLQIQVPKDREGRITRCPSCDLEQPARAVASCEAPASTIGFRCSACAYEADIPSRYAGHKVACPSCRHSQRVAVFVSGQDSQAQLALSRIGFSCAACGYLASVGPEYAGCSVRCPACRTMAQLPQGSGQDEAVPEPLAWACTECGEQALIPAEHAGRTVRCPSCSAVTIASAGGTDGNQDPSHDPDQVGGHAAAVDEDDAQESTSESDLWTESEGSGSTGLECEEPEDAVEEDRPTTRRSVPVSRRLPRDRRAPPAAGGRRRQSGRGLRWVAAGLVAGALLWPLVGGAALADRSPVLNPLPVEEESAEPVPAVFHLGRSNLAALDETRLRSAATGLVKAVRVEVGTWVEAGQVMIQLDATLEQQNHQDLQAELQHQLDLLAKSRQRVLIAEQYLASDRQRLIAATAAAESRARDAASRAERSAQLYARKLISQEEHESSREFMLQAEADLAVAQAQATELRAQELTLEMSRQEARKAEVDVERSHKRLAEVEGRLAAIDITAPVSGLVLELPVAAGDFVQHVDGGTVVARIAKLSVLIAELRVPESLIGRLEVGDSLRVRADAHPQRDFTGTLSRIAPVGTQTADGIAFAIRCEVPSVTGLLLRPGMSVDIDWLPPSGPRSGDGHWPIISPSHRQGTVESPAGPALGEAMAAQSGIR